MTHSIAIKRPSQRTTGEEYTRRFILLSPQPIFSHSDDIFGTGYRPFNIYVIPTNGAGPESIGNVVDF